MYPAVKGHASKFRLNNELGAKYRELFQHERDLSQKIHHANLVEAREFGELDDTGLPYLVMDYVDGPSLDEVLSKVRKISPANIAEIVTQVSQALKVLHEQHSYVHCDIKPGNILINREGKVYLTDLGVATKIGEKFTGLGVADYLPREVMDGMPVGAETDIYSLGQMMYFMLAEGATDALSQKGVVVKTARGPVQTNAIVEPSTDRPATRLRTIAASGGEKKRLAEIIQKCIAPKRENRYQSVELLLEDINSLRNEANLKHLVDRTHWQSSTS